MFKLAHLSDIHLPLHTDKISFRELASRRVTGYINWKFNRVRFLEKKMLDLLLSDLLDKQPDHCVITGDLVNLSLKAEFNQAASWLKKLGPSDWISIVPGNHDAYVPGALDLCFSILGPWMGGGDKKVIGLEDFPYLRIRERIALIGIASAWTSLPFVSAGRFRREEGKRLALLLDKTKKEKLCRVLMIHHPPVRGAVSFKAKLFGISRLQHIIEKHGVELVLHGHSHIPSISWIRGPAGSRVPVLGVSSASQVPDEKKPAAQWNLLEITQLNHNWNICLKRRGAIKKEDDRIIQIESLNIS